MKNKLIINQALTLLLALVTVFGAAKYSNLQTQEADSNTTNEKPVLVVDSIYPAAQYNDLGLLD